MKVYLVEKDNCESYEDYHDWIDGAFKTFRGASQSLINEGFEPYYERHFGESRLRFFWEESDEYMAKCQGARIIEIEVVGE